LLKTTLLYRKIIAVKAEIIENDFE